MFAALLLFYTHAVSMNNTFNIGMLGNIIKCKLESRTYSKKYFLQPV